MGEYSNNAMPHTEQTIPSSPRTIRLSNGRLKDEYYRPLPADYFAPKHGDQILEIGIVGAGIAGLTAASALVQSGHNVEVRQISVSSSMLYHF